MATNSNHYNHIIGALCIAVGLITIIVALGTLLLQLIAGVAALYVINYGLKLRGLPPLQMLIPMFATRKRWF